MAAILFGCSDAATDPCAGNACPDPNADLAVLSVRVAAGQMDPDGAPAVPADGFDVDIAIRNSGSGTSGEVPLVVRVGGVPSAFGTVPSLRPGHEATQTLHLRMPTDTFLVNADTARISATAIAADADLTNNTTYSDVFHVMLPALRVDFHLAQSQLVVASSVAATMSVTNTSRYATLQPRAVALCVIETGQSCGTSNQVRWLELPGLAPLQTVALEAQATVPPALGNPNIIKTLELRPCVQHSASSGVTSGQDCFSGALVEVRPDYEACNPVRMVPGQVFSMGGTCNSPCAIDVFSIDVTPGTSYFVQNEDGTEERLLRWRTRFRDEPVDASDEVGFQPATAARLYLVTAPKHCTEERLDHAVRVEAAR